MAAGGSDDDYADPEQTENLNEDTGDYDPNEEGRGNSGRTVNLSTITTDYIAQDGEVLTGNLVARAKSPSLTEQLLLSAM